MIKSQKKSLIVIFLIVIMMMSSYVLFLPRPVMAVNTGSVSSWYTGGSGQPESHKGSSYTPGTTVSNQGWIEAWLGTPISTDATGKLSADITFNAAAGVQINGEFEINTLSGGSSFTLTGTGSTTTQTVTVSTTGTPGQYTYPEIAVISVSGSTPPLAVFSVTNIHTGVPYPATPTGLNKGTVTSSSVPLSWGASSGATTYNIYKNGTEIQTGITGTSYTVNGLSSNTTFNFTVSASNSSGESAQSSSVSATTLLPTIGYVDGTVNLLPGTLTVTSPSVVTGFGNITLTGSTQSLFLGVGNWTVSDATGSGNGWHISLGASQLKETGGLNLTLPLNSLALTGSRSITAQPTSQTVDVTNGPFLQNQTSTLDSSTNGSVAAQIIDAKAGYGIGSYTINEPAQGFVLTLNPASVKIDTVNYSGSPTPYTCTLYYSIIAGP